MKILKSRLIGASLLASLAMAHSSAFAICASGSTSCVITDASPNVDSGVVVSVGSGSAASATGTFTNQISINGTLNSTVNTNVGFQISSATLNNGLAVGSSGSVNSPRIGSNSSYGYGLKILHTTINANTSVGNLYSGFGLYNGGQIVGGWEGGVYLSQSSVINGGINNSGAISGGVYGLLVDDTSQVNGGITNSGVIANNVYQALKIGRWGSATVDFITNTGSIFAPSGGIDVATGSSLTILNNLQGAGNSHGALTYSGNLPTYYNIIINSSDSYGRLDVSGPSGNMRFGIYNTSTVSAGRYTSVLSGIPTGQILTQSGDYGSFHWVLSPVGGAGNIWDLIFTSIGPSATDTQAALTRTASRLRSAYNKASQSSNFPTSNTYDCNLFDVHGMCVSAGGRYTSAENPHSHSTAAVLVLGYKVSDNLRIGGFLDQSIDNSAPAGIQISNKNPMMGAFVYWNQNADGLGYQVKLANTYQDKDITLTRDVIGTSESGTGKTGLTTESYVGELSYAFAYQDKTILRPYLGLRYTSIEQDGYTETGVTTPLTYSALKDETTAALIGVKFKHQLTEKATLTGSLGIEQDLHHKAGNFIATGVSGLTAENFSGDLHRTRGLASLGAYYAVAQSQRISGEVMLQELPFQNSLGATAYVNYMIGF
jgi:hypothetical protein